jgi:hypothetical protein
MQQNKDEPAEICTPTRKSKSRASRTVREPQNLAISVNLLRPKKISKLRKIGQPEFEPPDSERGLKKEKPTPDEGDGFC